MCICSAIVKPLKYKNQPLEAFYTDTNNKKLLNLHITSDKPYVCLLPFSQYFSSCFSDVIKL